MHLSDPELLRALETLLPRDRRILEMRGQGRTFDEIGVAFGISRAQAFRWAQAARQRLLAKLKRRARAERDSRADEGNVTDEL